MLGLLTMAGLGGLGYLVGKNVATWKQNVNNYQNSNNYQQILGDATQASLADREHNEMREDTAYQRAVADMKAAGLSPYTVGANSAASSASNAMENSYLNKLQTLGYVLDLRNVNMKTTQMANDMLQDTLRYAEENNTSRRFENWLTDFFGGSSNIWKKGKK